MHLFWRTGSRRKRAGGERCVDVLSSTMHTCPQLALLSLHLLLLMSFMLLLRRNGPQRSGIRYQIRVPGKRLRR